MGDLGGVRISPQPTFVRRDTRAGVAGATLGRDAPAMARRASPIRSALLGLLLAAAAGAAAAAEYVVVASTDPAILRGELFDAGARVSVTPGHKVTLMHASGDVLELRGKAGGVVLPKRAMNQAEADRLAILRVIVAPAERRT